MFPLPMQRIGYSAKETLQNYKINLEKEKKGKKNIIKKIIIIIVIIIVGFIIISPSTILKMTEKPLLQLQIYFYPKTNQVKDFL